MHTSRVLAAPLTWLVFTLLLSSVATGMETVKVTTTPVFTQIPRLQASKDFPVLVRVEAPPATQQQRRIPVELAVVLDVGGGGTRTTGTGTRRLDAVRKAVKFIISQIRDDDRLVIVAPPSISRVLGDEASKFLHVRVTRRNAETLHDELEPRGDRDEFTPGSVFLAKAIKILGELQATARRSRRARFVILVTDRATAEDSSRFSKLPREDDGLPTPVHTFGLGAAYDPRALHDIAAESLGTFSFVDEEEENVDGIAGAIAVCFSGLRDVAAVGTRVRVEAHVGSRVTIERIDSGGYASPIARYKDSGEVAVGVLYAGEVKSFLVHLSVPSLPPSTTPTTDDNGACCDKQQLLTVTATFVGSYEEGAAGAPASPSPAMTTTQATLYVDRPPPEAGSGGTLPQRVPVPVVMNHIAQFGVLEMVTTFVHNVIWKRTSITVDVVTKLRIQWEEFLQARQFWSGLDLGVLEVEVSSMLSILEGAAAGIGSASGSSTTTLSAATAYVLSWLSSYQMQRPTAMGSPDRVPATFVTVNMQLMVHQALISSSAPPCICGDDGSCPPCKDSCVQPEPPPVLVPSGLDDGTYHVNAAYLQVPGVLEAINEAMKQMYLALVQTNKLRRCDDPAGAEVLRAPSLARAASSLA